MKAVGITGNIASGKSTVTQYLREKGYNVVSADEISHDICMEGRPGYSAIVQEFGAGFLKADGSLDRKKLGDYVFADAEALSRLNALMWPMIKAETKTRSGGELAFIEAALLEEADMATEVDVIWVVTAAEETRIERLMARGGFTRDEALLRVRAQAAVDIPDAVLIQNDGTTDELHAKVDAALLQL